MWVNWTVQRLQTEQAVHLFVVFFFNCDLHMIQVCTPFSSFGNVWTVSKFWTPHDETLRGKTKSRNSPANKARSAWFARFAWSARSASLHFSMTVVAWMRAHESHLCDLKWIFSEWILDSFFSEILDSKSWILDSSAQYSGFYMQNVLDSGIRITLHKAKHLS